MEQSITLVLLQSEDCFQLSSSDCSMRRACYSAEEQDVDYVDVDVYDYIYYLYHDRHLC